MTSFRDTMCYHKSQWDGCWAPWKQRLCLLNATWTSMPTHKWHSANTVGMNRDLWPGTYECYKSQVSVWGWDSEPFFHPQLCDRQCWSSNVFQHTKMLPLWKLSHGSQEQSQEKMGRRMVREKEEIKCGSDSKWATNERRELDQEREPRSQKRS